MLIILLVVIGWENVMVKFYYKVVWLFDIYFGNKDCKVEFLFEFLYSILVDILYLVGDIVDMW